MTLNDLLQLLRQMGSERIREYLEEQIRDQARREMNTLRSSWASRIYFPRREDYECSWDLASMPAPIQRRRRTDYLKWYYYQTGCYDVVLGLYCELTGHRFEVLVDTSTAHTVRTAFLEIGRRLAHSSIVYDNEIHQFIIDSYELAMRRGVPHATRMNHYSQLFGSNIQEKSDETKLRAKELLLSCLTESQKEDFLKTERFIVTGSLGTRYRIEAHQMYNIRKLDDRYNVVARYCALPTQRLPVYDVMLAQKCVLETDEEQFLKVANKENGTPYF